MTDLKKIDAEASLWIVREDRGLREDEREALKLWLDAATAHRIAYIQMKRVWNSADRMAALRRPSPLREVRPGPSRMVPRIFAAAAVALICVAGAYWYRSSTPELNQIYTTGTGQQRTVRLEDGTRIELNTDSRMQAVITSSARTMHLEKGEAYFDVVHDETRPFSVLAGNRRITDIGTKFSVRLEGDQVRILVSEGKVKVETLEGNPSAPAVAGAGHSMIAEANSTLVINRAPQDLVRDMSWRSGILVFDQETLAAAADEFNRYNRKKIVVLGGARNLHIGGRFRANNADVFASLIGSGLGLNVQDGESEIIISK